MTRELETSAVLLYYLLLTQVTADINARPGFQDKLHPPFVFPFFTASFLMSQVSYYFVL